MELFIFYYLFCIIFQHGYNNYDSRIDLSARIVMTIVSCIISPIFVPYNIGQYLRKHSYDE